MGLDTNKNKVNIIKQHLESGNYIFAKIHGENVKILIDTGSYSNIIDFELTKYLHLTIKPPKSIFSLYTANANRMPVIGITEFNIKIGNCNFLAEAYVVKNLSEKILIGRKFLRNYKCIINYYENSLTIDDICQIPIDNVISRQQTVHAATNIEVAPQSVAVVNVTIDQSLINKDLLITNRPGKQFQKFGIQRMLIHPKEKCFPCKILNFWQNPITIKAGEVIAQAEPIHQENCCELYTDDDVKIYEKSLQEKHIKINSVSEQNCDQTAKENTLTDEQRRILDKFITEYKLKINKDLPEKDYYAIAKLLYRYREIFVTDVLKLKPLNIPPARWYTKQHGNNSTISVISGIDDRN